MGARLGWQSGAGELRTLREFVRAFWKAKGGARVPDLAIWRDKASTLRQLHTCHGLLTICGTILWIEMWTQPSTDNSDLTEWTLPEGQYPNHFDIFRCWFAGNNIWQNLEMSGKLAATTVQLAHLKLKRTVIYYFFLGRIYLLICKQASR